MSLSAGEKDRAFWVATMDKIVRPILTALSQRKLKATMPVELNPGVHAPRQLVTHLEALGRSLAGLSAWIELGTDSTDEGKLRGELADLARQAIDAGTDPHSPDFMNFTKHVQPLVDAAFLSHAIVRAPKELWQKLPDRVKQNTINALQSSRVIKAGMNNWLLFAAMIETALYKVGAEWKPEPIDLALKSMMLWYKGDSIYGDGAPLHYDYYNSFVIHPMLVDVIEIVGKEKPEWAALRTHIITRAQRYAAIQERLISPEGTFPAVGRSLAYRFGAFQLLGQMALRRQLPNEISPGQVRCALSAVIRKMIEAPDTFDKNGFLQIGFCGHQATIGESYISTGSLYLCTVGLLPLGLSANDEFWTCDPSEWTAQRAWSGQSISADHAIKD
jgi:hypothetical protein